MWFLDGRNVFDVIAAAERERRVIPYDVWVELDAFDEPELVDIARMPADVDRRTRYRAPIRGVPTRPQTISRGKQSARFRRFCRPSGRSEELDEPDNGDYEHEVGKLAESMPALRSVA